MNRIWLERSLWWTAAAGLLWSAQFYGLGAWKQWQGQKEVAAFAASKPTENRPRELRPGMVLGRIEIPRLGTSAVIFEGSTEEQLQAGVGHIEGTSYDLADGNIALAAHRDTFFSSLHDVQTSDVLTLTTADGSAHYQVDSTQIVQPWNTEVLRPTSKPALTLITCYPFEFFGHAPQRFIVRAEQVDRSPGF